MPELEPSAGTIHYEDSGGRGPVLVLTHGLLMDASIWDPVLAELNGDWRVVRPVLPLGARAPRWSGSSASCCCRAGRSTTSHPGCRGASQALPAGCRAAFASPSRSSASAVSASCPRTSAG